MAIGAFDAERSNRLIPEADRDTDKGHLCGSFVGRSNPIEKERLGGDRGDHHRSPGLNNAACYSLSETVPGALPLVIRESHSIVNKDLGGATVEYGQRGIFDVHVPCEGLQDRFDRRSDIGGLIQECTCFEKKRECSCSFQRFRQRGPHFRWNSQRVPQGCYIFVCHIDVPVSGPISTGSSQLLGRRFLTILYAILVPQISTPDVSSRTTTP